MKVMNIKTNFTSSPRYSFKGLEPTKPNWNALSQQHVKLKNELQKQLELLGRVGSDFEQQSLINDKIEAISNQFRTINEAYNSVISSNDTKAIEIISAWLEKRNKMDSETGFNKIFGLEDVKTKLDNEFVVKTMLKAQIADNANSQTLKQNVTIPNSMLFYGPSGCGKSFFATALAEQALTNKYRVDAGMLDKNTAFDKILECAQAARDNYYNSPDKQRSIIVVDEINSLVRHDSPVLEPFKNFMKDCSDKYKCTLFLTSNAPLDIDKEVLSNISTKIPIAPPNKQLIISYLTSKLAQINISDKNNIENVAENLCKNPEQMYSFRLIERILQKAMQSGENFIFTTINNIIDKKTIKPSIKLSDIELFKEAKRILM